MSAHCCAHSRPHAAGEAPRVWRPPTWARACAITIAACYLAALAICLDQVAEGTWRGLNALCAAAGTSLTIGLVTGYVTRSRVILTADTLIVVNTVRTHAVPLTEITGITGIIPGLVIRRCARRPVVAGAAPFARCGLVIPLSHSGEIAEAIMAAARRHNTHP